MTLESVGNKIIFKNATGMHVLIQPKKKGHWKANLKFCFSITKIDYGVTNPLYDSLAYLCLFAFVG